ncbi:hypothetical protein OZX60_06805 [Streptococcaceae bacterium ESL0687]|nr:hypothetical protein OZX60_06805 [Streptococcaceae bacterium ESL0687]
MILERKTPTTLSWADGSVVSSNSETISQGNFEDNFYWTDPGTDRNLVFRIFDSSNNQVGSDFTGAKTNGGTGYNSFTYYILEANLAAGHTYTFTIRVYKATAGGALIEETSSPPLTIAITVTNPTVTLISTPSNLSWTNRTITETKGVLERDLGNDMTISVKDTRTIPQNWVLRTFVEGTEDFSLVWKANSGSSLEPLDTHIVFTNGDVSRDGNNLYTKTWTKDVGILLDSSNYMNIGDYNNLSIVWILAVTP